MHLAKNQCCLTQTQKGVGSSLWLCKAFWLGCVILRCYPNGKQININKRTHLSQQYISAAQPYEYDPWHIYQHCLNIAGMLHKTWFTPASKVLSCSKDFASQGDDYLLEMKCQNIDGMDDYTLRYLGVGSLTVWARGAFKLVGAWQPEQQVNRKN